MSAAYDPQNTFAKILKQKLPCCKVYEDAFSLAFMDIMPLVDGHVLVISKTPTRNILDCPAEALTGMILTIQRIARATMHAFQADGITIQQFNETAGGQEIFHLHFHVLPRKTGRQIRKRPVTVVETSILQVQAAAIRNAMSSL